MMIVNVTFPVFILNLSHTYPPLQREVMGKTFRAVGKFSFLGETLFLKFMNSVVLTDY